MPLRPGDGAKTTIWTRGSETVLNFVHAAKKKRRMVLMGAVASAVIAGIIAFGTLRYLSAQQATRVVQSYGSLSRCLLGAPLEQGEKASVRFRAVQLTALTSAEVARTSADPQWPERCALHAHNLHDSLSKTDLGDEAGKPLVASAKALGEALEKKGSHAEDLSAEVDAAFDHARAANVAFVAQPNVLEPPTPTLAPNIDTMPETARLAAEQLELSALVTSPHGSGTVRWLGTAEARQAKPSICTVRADKAACAAFPKPIAEAAAAGLSLLGTADEDGATLVFAAEGTQGIFRSDNGIPFEAAKSIGGYTAVDGFSAVLALDGDRLQLLRSDGDKVSKSNASPGFRAKMLNATRDAQLLWGHVLFVTRDDDQLSLVAAPVDAKRGLGDVEEVGALGKESVAEAEASTTPRIDGCHTAQTSIARIRVGRLSFLSFRLANRWTAPVNAGPAGGSLSCHAKEAVITQIGSQGGSALTSTITQHVCSPTACVTTTAVMADVLGTEAGLAPTEEITAVGLDGKVLLVWNAGQRAGVRMRYATTQNLAKTSDTIIFDGFVSGGGVVAQNTVLTQRVLVAEDFAIILLNTTAGVFALRVSKDGKIAPATITASG